MAKALEWGKCVFVVVSGREFDVYPPGADDFGSPSVTGLSRELAAQSAQQTGRGRPG